MAKTISAQNFITITDLNDAMQMTCYLNASLGEVQSWNKDTKQPLEDYTKTANVITPSVYITGRSEKQPIQSASYEITETGQAAVTVTSSSAVTGFSVDAKTGALSIKKNLAGAYMNIKATITAQDNLGNTVTMSPGITISRNENSTSALIVNIVAGKGLAFDSANPTQLTVKAVAIRGGEVDKSSITWTWEKLVGDAWQKITTGVSTATDASTLTMSSDNVDNFLNCRVTAADSEIGDSASYYFTFEDKTDPYSVQLMTYTGDVIKNGQGDTTIYAAVYHGTELLEDKDTETKQFTYTWELYDQSGAKKVWNDTTNKSGKGLTSVVVKAADVVNKATVVCKVTK